MNAFIVGVEDRPGTMAQMTEAVAARGVNILVLTVGLGDGGAVAFVCNDEDGARSALAGGRALVPGVARRPNQDGGQARAVRRCGQEAGRRRGQLEFSMPVDTSKDRFTVAVGVDDEESAKQALSDQLTDWTYS